MFFFCLSVGIVPICHVRFFILFRNVLFSMVKIFASRGTAYYYRNFRAIFLKSKIEYYIIDWSIIDLSIIGGLHD